MDAPMTPAEFRVVREWLGLTHRWIADHLGLAERSVERWETGARTIPDHRRTQIEALEAVTAAEVARIVALLGDARDVAITTYRTDADAAAAGSRWPASWHRAVTARVMHEVPGLSVGYWTAPTVTAGTAANDSEEAS